MIEDFKRLGKGSIIYGLGNAINQLFGVLVLPLFTRFLTPEEYGIISYFAFISIILQTIFLIGLPTSIGLIYFDYSENHKRKELIFNSFILMLISASILAILGVTFSDSLSVLILHSSKFNYLFILNIFISFCAILIYPFMLRLQFEEKQFQYISISIISTIINLGLAVLFVVVLLRGAEGRLESNLIANIIVFGLWFYVGVKGIKIKFNLTIWKNLIKLGTPMILWTLCIYITDRGGVFFLERYFTLKEVGLYSIGYIIGAGIILITSSFYVAWYPFFLSFSNKKDEASVLFGKILTYFIYIVGAVVILFFIIAKQLLIIFSTESYFEGYKIIGLTSLSFFILSISYFLYPAFYFGKKTNYLMFTQLISTLIFVVLAILIVPYYGIIGASITNLLTNLALIFISYYFIKFGIKNPFKIKFEFKRLCYYLCLLVVAIFIINMDLIDDIMINTIVNFTLFMSMFTFFILQTIKKDLRYSNRSDNIISIIKVFLKEKLKLII